MDRFPRMPSVISVCVFGLLVGVVVNGMPQQGSSQMRPLSRAEAEALTGGAPSLWCYASTCTGDDSENGDPNACGGNACPQGRTPGTNCVKLGYPQHPESCNSSLGNETCSQELDFVCVVCIKERKCRCSVDEEFNNVCSNLTALEERVPTWLSLTDTDACQYELSGNCDPLPPVAKARRQFTYDTVAFAATP